MSADLPDIQVFLDQDYPLPQPKADVALSWIEREQNPDRRAAIATQLSRAWLTAVGHAIDPLYRVAESSHFLVLGAQVYTPNDAVLRTAEQCRARMQSLLPGIAEFHSTGKLALLVLYGTEAYYDHIAYYHGEGQFGGSSGMFIHGEWSHVVMLETAPASLHKTVAHELTHVALAGRSMPLWIEEGLGSV